MKYSRISYGRDGVLRLSTLDAEKFYQRIQQDTSDFVVGFFREDLPHLSSPNKYRHYHELSRFCPAVELQRQPNGALAFRRYNGLVVLDVKGVVGRAQQDFVKSRVMSLPFTVAAFTGSTGKSVKLLARVARADGTVPQTETEVEAFYLQAHRQLVTLYNALIAPHTVVAETPGSRHAFLMPLDEHPRLNPDPSMPHFNVVDSAAAVPSASDASTDAFASVPPPLHEERSTDWERYEIYERTYEECVRRTLEITKIPPRDDMNITFLSELARQLALAGLPQEEAFQHMWQHLKFQRGSDEGAVRVTVDASFATVLEDRHSVIAKPGAVGADMRRLIRMLEQRYVFRYNVIMGYAEMRRNTTMYWPWTPVTKRTVADLTLEARLNEIPIWENDIQRYIDSSRVRDYSMIESYLSRCPQWDGRDHIRALARTVPTQAQQWPDWFHTWFLGMVAQWQHRNIRFGNALVPLLISRQGYHKSDFCRQLLPPELRSWGFTDALSMGEERPVFLAMAQMLLISLDEFNQISPKRQEGFLKNIIQMPTVKVRPPHGRHIEEMTRLASFIATTNQPDVLSDPSGSRRFVGIYVDGDIDTRQTPNHPQLFAQAMAELNDGVRYWLDGEETAVLMEHNRQFQLRTDAISFFYEYFTLTSDAVHGEWMTAAQLLSEIKRRAGAALKHVPTLNKFARELRNLPDIQIRGAHGSDKYLVKLKS